MTRWGDAILAGSARRLPPPYEGSDLVKSFNNLLKSLTTSYKDVKGDIKIRTPINLYVPKKTAGPEPIDRPNTIMSFGLILTFLVKYS